MSKRRREQHESEAANEKPKQRSAAHRARQTEQELADRVATTLDPIGIGGRTQQAVEQSQAMAEGALDQAQAIGDDTVRSGREATEMANKWLGQGLTAFRTSLEGLQTVARDATQSLTDNRIQSAQAFANLSSKLMEMAQSNMSDGINAVQKMLRARNVGEVIQIQTHFAQGWVKTMANQAAEIRDLSMTMARQAQPSAAAALDEPSERGERARRR